MTLSVVSQWPVGGSRWSVASDPSTHPPRPGKVNYWPIACCTPMPFVAILGAGPLGGALTYALASRNRFDEVRLVDPSGTLAQGKALDVHQAGPPDGWSTRVSGSADIGATRGAWALVLADPSSDVTDLLRATIPAAPGALLVCADASHGPLVRTLVGTGLASPDALIGSAPVAARGAAQALLAAACDVSASEVIVSLAMADTASGLTIDWALTSLRGRPAEDTLTRERRDHVAQLFSRAWPPGPLALAAAAARVAEAAWFGSRRTYPVWVATARAAALRSQHPPPPPLAMMRCEAGGRLVNLTDGR